MLEASILHYYDFKLLTRVEMDASNGVITEVMSQQDLQTQFVTDEQVHKTTTARIEQGIRARSSVTQVRLRLNRYGVSDLTLLTVYIASRGAQCLSFLFFSL
jgi:hypothetical protein